MECLRVLQGENGAVGVELLAEEDQGRDAASAQHGGRALLPSLLTGRHQAATSMHGR